MDEKILFYIVVGVIYFLFNRLKKGKPVEEENNPPQEGAPKPISFEDLLREITEAKKPIEIPPVKNKTDYQTVAPQQPVYEDYDDLIEEETRSLETIAIDDDRSAKAYEEAKAMAFSRPSLEEVPDQKDSKVKYGKFRHFEAKGKGNATEYLKDLRNSKSLKRALILNEVLNRRHF